ncbi:ISAs1 family transposase [Acidithiobacillus thiooxidans]|uniref:ISAs1 family transposase n=1 Tax=Acidithiobacillus TaxID=119977 RepID=UPI00112261CD|nr:ISAs1 family transposase [Acidithiobacillus albertensis]MBU2748854.1 ISAs1 family transposase [Acidithiobacillus montserratensis]MBU2751180.1 ISAs1 family transposase [Acidithiobacillus thiooxidans]MBU2839651.1 ISAs1 family transposase [Acidithiobacillus thiooxidans]
MFPLNAETTEVGHGRFEYRKIIVATRATGLHFPHVGQAFLIQRSTINSKEGTIRDDYAFGLTSLTPDRATPENLLGLARGHWEIENRNHHVRDVTFHEDLSQVRTQNGPHMMATLRELAMSIMRLTGVKNIAKACRDFAASAHKTLRQLGY